MGGIMDNYYKGRRVLVTGADGFMGSHLTERLVEMGAIVTAFVRGTSNSGTSELSLKNIAHLKGKIKIIAGDISNEDSVNIIKREEPSVILHLAASAYVPYSFDHPKEVTAINLTGTLNVMEAAMNSSVERTVITSSSEAYGTAVRVPINEDHPLNPTSPYAASKAAADRYAFSYWKTYGLPIAIMRPFNTYGPRHIYDVIPKFIKLALEGKPLTVYGSGEQTRDFSYVSDTVSGFLLMGSHPAAKGEAVNFGSGREISIGDLAKLIVKSCNSKSQVSFEKGRLAEVGRLLCDYSKANRLFGWSPKVPLEEGLQKNIAWLRENSG
jgi:nucleoside-diphosphate-sugar epimerase